MRIVFAGTPELAVPALRQISARYTVCGVLTGTDKAAGRGKQLAASPVKAAAVELGLNLYQPVKFDKAFCETIAALEPELLVVVAYWKIFPSSFLAIFPGGGINLHPSLLPAFRGASPIPAAILSGASRWGITVQQLALEMDAGDILLQESFPLEGHETTESLMKASGEHGAGMLVKVIGELEAGRAKGVPQDHQAATYCSLIRKEDGVIDWQEPAAVIDRKIRAFFPWPKAFTFFRGKRLVIHAASLYAGHIETAGVSPGTIMALDKKTGLLVQTGSGVLAITKMQLQAKKTVDYRAFANGQKEVVGSVLGA